VSGFTLTTLPVGRAPITQHFGANPAAYARFGQAGHNGVDFGVPLYTAVHAAAAGMVAKTGSDPKGYGLYVILKHTNGYQTLYAHLGRVMVDTGEELPAGSVLGLSGSTGNSTGPHLHFELRRDTAKSTSYPQGAVNPLGYYAAVEPAPEPLVFPTPTPLVPPSPGCYTVIVPSLRIRLEPTTEAAIVGALAQGLAVEVIGSSIEANGVIWVPVRLWIGAAQDGAALIERVPDAEAPARVGCAFGSTWEV
jgi:hypothetical protein